MLRNSKVQDPSEKTTLNKCFFKCFTKVSGPTDRSLNATGNLFQQQLLGPATAKALKPQFGCVARVRKFLETLAILTLRDGIKRYGSFGCTFGLI